MDFTQEALDALQKNLTTGVDYGNKTTKMRSPYSYRDYMNQLKQMEYEEGGKAEGPNYPHDMYNPNTGEKFVAENEEDHNRMDKLGYKHLDQLSDSEKQIIMQKKNEMEEGGEIQQKMAMGGKYEQFKRLMGLD